MKKFFAKLLSRTTITGLLIIVQLLWLVALIFRVGEALPVIQDVLEVVSFIAIVFIVRTEMNPSYKIGWVTVIVLLPVLGGLMFLVFGNKRPSRHMRKRLGNELEKSKAYFGGKTEELAQLKAQDPVAGGLFEYLEGAGGYPTGKNTKLEYFSVGEDMYDEMLFELEKAEKFIFLEYFIIKPGHMWNGILDILKRKAAAGVDVRLIYDDMGCADHLPRHYADMLRKFNIKTIAFNRFIPAVSMVMNNRDHRKILVIDGKVGFTGGINLSDEYINKWERFGHWKDTGLMLRGEGVKNLTVMFLEMWNAYNEPEGGYADFVLSDFEEKGDDNDGYLLSFSDSPLDDENVGESVYIDMLYQARDYAYITTPYLVIDSELQNAMCMAAKRGVDVRIITPGIPDKKMVYQLTRSYYPPLLKAGVKIYEYTPGFIHAKSMVADDKLGIVGTINFDYRSLYLHFECGTLFYKNPAIGDLRKDIESTVEVSRRVELSDCRTSIFGEILNSLLRLVAPLM